MSTLLEDWREFERNILPADFGVEQRRKAMFAFYAGAMRVADRLVTPDEVNHHFVIDLHVECQAIANALAEEYGGRPRKIAVEMPGTTK
jgi:hypothetical protein